MKTAEELQVEYANSKKKKTIRQWKKNLDIKVDLDKFNHFKENKKYYLQLRELEEIKKRLDPEILGQILGGI